MPYVILIVEEKVHFERKRNEKRETKPYTHVHTRHHVAAAAADDSRKIAIYLL